MTFTELKETASAAEKDFHVLANFLELRASNKDEEKAVGLILFNLIDEYNKLLKDYRNMLIRFQESEGRRFE